MTTTPDEDSEQMGKGRYISEFERRKMIVTSTLNEDEEEEDDTERIEVN